MFAKAASTLHITYQGTLFARYIPLNAEEQGTSSTAREIRQISPRLHWQYRTSALNHAWRDAAYVCVLASEYWTLCSGTSRDLRIHAHVLRIHTKYMDTVRVPHKEPDRRPPPGWKEAWRRRVGVTVQCSNSFLAERSGSFDLRLPVRRMLSSCKSSLAIPSPLFLLSNLHRASRQPPFFSPSILRAPCHTKRPLSQPRLRAQPTPSRTEEKTKKN